MKKLHDYTAIDTAILTVLSFGPKRLSGMFSGPVWQEARKLESADYKARGIAYTSSPYFISNRLNALRKLGKLGFATKTGWYLETNQSDTTEPSSVKNEIVRLQSIEKKYNWLMNHACWGYPSAEGSNGEEIYLVITGTKADDFEHAERILAQAMKELP